MRGSIPARSRVLSAKQLPALVRKLRAARKKIVFTNGCFDLIHPGHVAVLEFARRQGDVLIVAVNSDSSVRRLKGPQRPILSLKDRLAVLAAVRWVDFLVPFSTPTPEPLIAVVRPDVLVKGADWKSGEIAGASYAKKVQRFPLKAGFSTTYLIEKISALK